MTDTITVSRELLRKAIESLEATCGHRCNAEYNPCNEQELVWQLRAALGAEPAPVQEPPSTPTYDYVNLTRAIYTRMQMECVGRSKWEELDGYEQQRFVAAVERCMPAQKQTCNGTLIVSPRKAVKLTRDELDAMCDQAVSYYQLGRVVEQAVWAKLGVTE